ncbi:hypothetical protein ARMSODRAFT_990134 [Armillaria solidipes]|uniref:CxC2-like cysteine cluster KDZ transposase-associated domain-containing protein n=1 Tax=Armillaria solidipes TaxID=1076256 RepID=A0A2H3BCU0_9AGAR|nr:hypothetical protein ARMSODRAFT_990134 [Armillaria solidipes]
MPAFEIVNRKRRRVGARTHYNDRIDLEDDYEVIYSHENSVSAAGHVYEAPVTSHTATWVIGDSWAPGDNHEMALDPTGQWFDEELECEVYESRIFQQSECVDEVPKKIRQRSKTSERYRSEYLDEICRHEGRGDYRVQMPEYRCIDCFIDDLVCKECCRRRHRLEPLHRIQRWNGEHFESTCLRKIGLRVQLNHTSMRCRAPIPGHIAFKVLHTTGIHDIAMDYCGCERQIPYHKQLLRRGWYPASHKTPTTCATFHLLEFLHLLSLCSKVSVYDFYRTLEKTSVNTGLAVSKSRIKMLMRMKLQWAHLKLLKRGGRAHCSDGVATTKPRDLAVLCPSCPRPGVNLPEGWESAPPEYQFLYVVILCMDANFRLKNQIVSSFSRDPGLGIGWAYFVPKEDFDRYIRSHTSDEDISTCVGFAALAKADTKFSKGLRFTGVGAVSCARSEFIVAVGNLHKGERYAPMDFIFGTALRDFTKLLFGIISYDIACQWFINLYTQMLGWPTSLKVDGPLTLTPVIPKFHEPAHHAEDHHAFSCNLVKGLGNCDCEGPERIWGSHNALGNSTKTMGPGSRHDVLDDHFGFWNWLKYAAMGLTLARKYRAAIKERLSANLPADLVEGWDRLCVEWENAGFPKDVENPFHVDGEFLSEKEVEEELQEEEEERQRRGGIVRHGTSADKFIILGLQLEDSQAKIRAMAAKHRNKTLTERQDTTLMDQRNVLRTKLESWEPLRAIYMPGLLQYLTDIGDSNGMSLEDADRNPEEMKLWLPSEIPSEWRHEVCVEGLPAIEDRLRMAQCNDALQGIRHALRLKLRMVQFKNKNTRGQHATTRSRSVIDGVHQRALAFATKYRTARQVKLQLIGPGEWEEVLRVLQNKDIRAYTDPECATRGPGRRGTNEDSDEPCRDSELPPEEEINVELDDRGLHGGTGETRRTLSWIWLTTTINLEDGTDKNDEILRSEWCRSRARAKRSEEEVLLLREEMRRVLCFLRWKAEWWVQRIERRDVQRDEGLREGLRVYAGRQRDLQLALRARFQELWTTPLEDMDKEGDLLTHGRSSGNENQGDDDGDDGEESDDDESDGDGDGSDGFDSQDEEDATE